jgi:hypothetical protein
MVLLMPVWMKKIFYSLKLQKKRGSILKVLSLGIFFVKGSQSMRMERVVEENDVYELIRIVSGKKDNKKTDACAHVGIRALLF